MSEVSLHRDDESLRPHLLSLPLEIRSNILDQFVYSSFDNLKLGVLLDDELHQRYSKTLYKHIKLDETSADNLFLAGCDSRLNKLLDEGTTILNLDTFPAALTRMELRRFEIFQFMTHLTLDHEDNLLDWYLALISLPKRLRKKPSRIFDICLSVRGLGQSYARCSMMAIGWEG